MARVTVQDCLTHVPNRFDLVLVASKRARQLAHGKDATLDWDNDKPTVLALREIAEATVDASVLNEVVAEEHAEEHVAGDEEIRQELAPEPLPADEEPEEEIEQQAQGEEPDEEQEG